MASSPSSGLRLYRLEGFPRSDDYGLGAQLFPVFEPPTASNEQPAVHHVAHVKGMVTPLKTTQVVEGETVFGVSGWQLATFNMQGDVVDSVTLPAGSEPQTDAERYQALAAQIASVLNLDDKFQIFAVAK